VEGAARRPAANTPKGWGREFTAWPKAPERAHLLVLAFECAKGSRKDIVLNGSVPIFVNRKIILEFLKSLEATSDNRLAKFLSKTLSCNEITAALRVNTLWKYTFSEPARWLSGKAETLNEWSIDSASEVLDQIEKAMVAVAADGHALLDPSFDPFAEIAAKQPAFRRWREEQQMARVQKAADGSQHEPDKLALSEARSPQGKGNAQATERVVALAEKMANGALTAMRDPRRAISSLLTSQEGECAVGKDPSVHKATVGAHVTTDRVESNFGCIDILMRMFRYTTTENISGMAQQMRNQDFERPPPVLSDRRKRKHQPAAHLGGFFYSGLSAELQASLVAYSRKAAVGARADGRLALSAQEAEKLARREERLQTLLNNTVERYAYAKELFNAWAKEGGQRACSKQAVKAALLDDKGRDKPEAQKLEYLRNQIEMRVLGLGWTQYSTRWSSNADERIGSVAHLHGLLDEIIDEERSRARFTAGTEKGLPVEACPPQERWSCGPQLGTLDVDAQEVCSQSLFDRAQLERLAAKEMERRVAAGIADDVEVLQQKEAPAFDQQLVGKRLEVLWRYYDKNTQEPRMIWSTGTVRRVADGLTDKRSHRARKILPGGALLWAWDADPEFDEVAGEQWLVLLPSKWNPSTHKQVYSWRYDPRELGATRAATPDARRKHMRRDVSDA